MKIAENTSRPTTSNIENRASLKLSQAIGLSKDYRTIWANWVKENITDDAFVSLMNPVVLNHLDNESRKLLNLSCDLSAYVANNPLSQYLRIEAGAALALLPRETQTSLADFGFLRRKNGSALAALDETEQAEIYDADETFSHYGLRYISEIVDSHLANRDAIDAGSYDGSAAKFFLASYPVSRVFCFEPDPANFHLLEQNTTTERTTGALVATQAALSNRSGLAKMGQSGVGTSTSKADLNTQPSIVVNTVSLDEFVASLSEANIGLVKLDVEGDAVQVLEGAYNTIKKQVPILIISFYHTPSEFTATLPFLLSNFPEYDFCVRKVTPNLFKENVVIGVPRSMNSTL